MQLKNDGTYGGIRVYTTMQLKNDGILYMVVRVYDHAA